MAKPMCKLRARMMEMDVEREECVKAIRRKDTYWSDRIMERKYFDLGDIYILCDLLKIPYEQIPEYFPRINAV